MFNNNNQFMLNPRNKRIKTDFNNYYPNRNISALNIIKQTPLQPAKPTVKQPKQPVLFKFLDLIKGLTNYDEMTDNQIRIENDILKQKVRDLNGMISKQNGKSLERKWSASRILNKVTIQKDIGMNISDEYTINLQLIKKYEQQLAEHQQKLDYLDNFDKQMTFDKKRLELMIVCKQLKEQLIRMKKNKNLRQKQIMKYSSSQQQEQLQQLRCEYVTLSKKAQHAAQRVKVTEKEIIEGQVNMIKLKQLNDEIRNEYNKIIQQQQHLRQNQTQEQLSLAYNNRKKKMQLMVRRIQRDQQHKKRKYYNMLVQLESLKQRNYKLQQNICISIGHNKRLLQYVQELMQLIDQVKQTNTFSSELPKLHSIQTNDSSFFITNLVNKRARHSSPKHSPIDNINQLSNYVSQCPSQKKFNQSNIKRMRKWGINKQMVMKYGDIQMFERQNKEQSSSHDNECRENNEDVKLHLRQRIKVIRTKTQGNIESSFGKIKINQFHHKYDGNK